MTRAVKAIAIVTALAALLAGCSPVRDRGAATESRSITVGGEQREYLVHVPDHLSDQPSLVVFLHGGFGSAAQAESAYGWDALAEREGIIVAYPEGDGVAWNAGSCCGSPAKTDVDDVAFITALTAQLQTEFGVAPSRTFATGMSNGAMMAYRMACDTAVFAAIAPVAGTIVTECDAPRPASVLHIHGLLDERVRYDGETGSGATRVDGLAVEEAVALWRTADGCGTPTVIDAAPVTTSSTECADGREVTLITIADAGHQWPGADGKRVADPDAVSTAIDATEVIWQFFERAA
jgi:polyhydroxybutyrate depolymerase